VKRREEYVGNYNEVFMIQQDPYFFFSRPMTYYGSFQQLEDEIDQDEESTDPSSFILNVYMKHPEEQTIGLYLHWLE
jgi:hypothetical protein